MNPNDTLIQAQHKQMRRPRGQFQMPALVKRPSCRLRRVQIINSRAHSLALRLNAQSV